MRIVTAIASLLLVGLSSAHPQYPSGGAGEEVIEGPVVEPVSAGCPLFTHECLPFYQCNDKGEINTDGSGLIDVRFGPKKCIHPDHPDVPALCCKIPGVPEPVSACPGGQVCLEHNQCNPDGTVNTDGAGIFDVRIHLTCYIDGPVLTQGRCCQPPIPIIDVCPVDSVCIPKILCQGDIIDSHNNYQPFDTQTTWSECPIAGDVGTNGVCCRNPVVTPPPLPVANQCGIRNPGSELSYKVQLLKNEALFGEFPWQAVLFFSNFTFVCGASLVTDRFLVTAAHCVYGYNYGDFRVRLGEWQVDSYDEPLPYIDSEIASIQYHPSFNPKNLHNDVAVIELLNPVSFQYHINTVCLPRPDQYLEPGTRCFASGWGKDAFDGAYQPRLKKVDVPFVPHQYCQDLLRQTRLGRYFILDKSFMCAGGEPNQDACTGDGGGPLVCEDPHTGSYVLHGITAWGINCGQADVPGVYADVQYFSDWISDAIFGIPVAEVNAPHNPYGKK